MKNHMQFLKKSKKRHFVCVCVMRILRIYSLNNFQVCHRAVLTIVIMLCITPLLLVYPITLTAPRLVTTNLISFTMNLFFVFFF